MDAVCWNANAAYVSFHLARAYGLVTSSVGNAF